MRDALAYVSGYGVEAGDWWGDPTGDMRPDDAGSLVYDGEPVTRAVEIIGFPRVRLTVDASAPLANWAVRLEDVAPTGEVALVTGAALNGAQIHSRLAPTRLLPGRRYSATVDLHFTTWTFQPGHRVRLAVSNAQFPMLWPTPYPMTTGLAVEGIRTVVQLPVVHGHVGTAPTLPRSVPRALPPDGRLLDDAPPTTRRVTTDVLTGATTVDMRTGLAYEIAGRRYHVDESERYETTASNPAASHFVGDETHRVDIGPRTVLLHTRIDVRSDSAWLYTTVTRELSENDHMVRTRSWSDSTARVFH